MPVGDFLPIRSIHSDSTARLPTSISVHINNPRPRQEAGGLLAALFMPYILPSSLRTLWRLSEGPWVDEDEKADRVRTRGTWERRWSECDREVGAINDCVDNEVGAESRIKKKKQKKQESEKNMKMTGRGGE